MCKLICKLFNRHRWQRVNLRGCVLDKCTHCGRHRSVTMGVPQ